ncbi:MAG: thioredoxin family protein [Bacteroidetes bacterium]|nr:thioredoxin family protein [Bacteroidota bacterium]
MKPLHLLSLLGTSLFVLACSSSKEIKPAEPPKHYPHGNFTYQQFADSSGWKQWIDTGYEINPGDLDILKMDLRPYSIKIYAGVWCGDSKEQVPRFFHILDEAGYPKEDIEYILLNRDRAAWKALAGADSIKKVPTFILMKDGKETGRITETPKVKLETDLVEIILKDR